MFSYLSGSYSDADDVPPELPLDSLAYDRELGMSVSPELPQDADNSVSPNTGPNPETCDLDLCDVDSTSSSDGESGNRV